MKRSNDPLTAVMTSILKPAISPLEFQKLGTRSFGRDLRAGAAGQPGGLPNISRGLSAAIPPELVRKTSRTPKGGQNRSLFTSRNYRPELLARLQGTSPYRSPSGGVVALRAPQPPANRCKPS